MKSKVNVILLGILIFFLGAIAGAVSHYLYNEHFVRKTALKAGPPQPFDVVEAMARELKLDSQQKESLKLIIHESRKRYIALSKQLRPLYEKISNDGDQKIRDILRDDQKVIFENFLRKVHQPPSKRSSINGKRK